MQGDGWFLRLSPALAPCTNTSIRNTPLLRLTMIPTQAQRTCCRLCPIQRTNHQLDLWKSISFPTSFSPSPSSDFSDRPVWTASDLTSRPTQANSPNQDIHLLLLPFGAHGSRGDAHLQLVSLKFLLQSKHLSLHIIKTVLKIEQLIAISNGQ